jgi:Divergent InlB B-repeat domain/Hydrazine synthase alpha subunit middle domain
VTARDAADKQQPFNLRVPGGASSIVPGGHTNYDITHLQFLQADYLRGYNFNTTNVQPGRRILATPMHDTASFNPPSSKPNAPVGGSELMPDGSQATIVPAGRAVTWQLTGTNNNLSIVKERFWITFRPGEIRTCANCHGINDKDQLGRPSPTNPPEALRQLLRYWKTNGASSYQLTVNHGSGSGAYGAGSILSLTAQAAPSGQKFDHWAGAGVSSPTATTTSFIMPGSNMVVSATYTNLPAPQITAIQPSAGNQLQLSVQGIASQVYVIQASDDLVTWSNVSTNAADVNGGLLWSTTVSSGVPKRFFRVTFP